MGALVLAFVLGATLDPGVVLNDVPLRAAPEAGAATLDALETGTLVEVLGDRLALAPDRTRWYRVRTPEGLVGYVADPDLGIMPDSPHATWFDLGGPEPWIADIDGDQVPDTLWSPVVHNAEKQSTQTLALTTARTTAVVDPTHIHLGWWDHVTLTVLGAQDLDGDGVREIFIDERRGMEGGSARSLLVLRLAGDRIDPVGRTLLDETWTSGTTTCTEFALQPAPRGKRMRVTDAGVIAEVIAPKWDGAKVDFAVVKTGAAKAFMTRGYGLRRRPADPAGGRRLPARTEVTVIALMGERTDGEDQRMARVRAGEQQGWMPLRFLRFAGRCRP